MRETHRDHYRAPATGEDTETVLAAAIDSLDELRGFAGLADPPARLHLLASLIAQAERLLPATVADARHHGCSWAQIGDLLGVTRASAQQRYRRLTPDDPSYRAPADSRR